MKRIIISFGIIAAIIGVSIFSLIFMNKNNNEMFEQIDEITSLYENRSDDIQKEMASRHVIDTKVKQEKMTK